MTSSSHRHRRPPLLALLTLLLGLGAGIALTACGDEEATVADSRDPSLGVPSELEGEEGGEAAERHLTEEQAQPTGERSAPANRVSAPIGTRGRASAEPISGPTPLAGCPGLIGTIDNYEAEPDLVADPRNPRHLVAAWQQDRSYAARGNVASFSHDGGRTWRTVTVPGADTCQLRPDVLGVADPWLSYGPDGTVYLASLPGGAVPSPEGGIEIRSSVIVNRSSDGGRTWSQPGVVAPPDGFNDKPSIVADPTRAGRLYAVWERSSGGECQGGEECAPQILFSRSEDSGRHWSPARAVAADSTNVAQHNARVMVTGSGRVLVAFERGDFQETRRLTLVRSGDQGRSFSPPRTILTQTNYLPTGDGLRPFYAIFEEAVTVQPGSNTVYLAAARDHSDSTTGRSTVVLRRSTDGGRHWGKRRVVARVRGFSMLPSVRANARGAVAVTWYDYAADRSGDGEATASYRGAVRRLRDKRWKRTSFGSFNSDSCGDFSPPALPGPKLPWIGEYFGLTATGRGFATAFVGCGELSELGPEDILFGRLR